MIEKTAQSKMPVTWLSLTTAIILLFLGQPSPDPAIAQTSLEPTIISSNSEGLTMTWTLPPYQLRTVAVDGVEYSHLQMPGTTMSGQPGHPQLPLYSGLIGLPPAGQARLNIVELEREIVPLARPPLPAPIPQPVHLSPTEIDSESFRSGGPTRRIPDLALYAKAAFYPDRVVQLGPPRQIRDQRVAALTIYPVRVNPVSKQMEVVRFVRLEITFTDPVPESTASPGRRDRSDTLIQAIAASLLNPEATTWPDAPAAGSGATRESLTALAAGNVTKVMVVEAGLYALAYNDLQTAGLPVDSLDPRTLKLSHGYPRQQVAIRVEGEADGSFDPSDRLLFYAEPDFSRFVDYDVYFLTYGDGNGLRMSSRSGDPDNLPAGTAWRTATAELNQFYDPLYPGRDGDHWYWDKLQQPDKTTGSYTFQLEAPLTTGPAAGLTLWLQGYTNPVENPDHRLRVAVNGTVIGEKSWEGVQPVTAILTVPATALKNGQNLLQLSLPGAGTAIEGSWYDAMAIRYPIRQAGQGQLRFQGEAGQKQYLLTGWSSSNLSIYDISNPAAPSRVTNYDLVGPTLTVGDATTTPATYLIVPANQLKSPVSIEKAKIFSDPPHGADYIIVTPAALAAATAPLAAHRAAQGLWVVTVEAQTIYDNFGAGRLDPAAIRNFLEHAYHNWPAPAPLYVLLVGDGSYDFKNHSGYNAQTLLPPYLVDAVDPWWGETASDNRLVTLVGDDNLPDMLIGRLAVNSPAEAAAVVAKIINYETSPALGSWNARQLFVADNPDFAGNFHLDSDAAFDTVDSPFIGQRFYYDNSPDGQTHIYGDVASLRSSFVGNFNSGASLVTFHGHSSWLQWTVEGILLVDDVSQINNQNRLPVVLEMTCFTGFFHHPQYPTLDESLLRHTGGGAVAVWGSTGLGVSSGHDALQAGFRGSLTQAPFNLGAATLAGKMTLYATGFHQDLLDTFTLFGDPALRLNLDVKPVNYTDQVYLPLMFR